MVSATTGATAGAGVITDTSKSKLGRDAFLQLLVAQMSNQDPLKPVEDKEFISQLAQFSSLEQMQMVSQGVDTLNQTTMSGQSQYSFLQGVSLVGKTIEVPNPDYVAGEDIPQTIKGKVDSVDFRYSEPILKVGEKTFALSSVLSVS